MGESTEYDNHNWSNIMSANPYTPPRAQVADVGSDEVQEIKLWSAAGRIGRLRYLAYTAAASLIVGAVAAAVGAALGPSGNIVLLALYVPLLVFSVLTGIKRSHDMDWSGWMLLLSIIPLVGLIWIFKSGTQGPNRFGAPPPPNTTGVKILAFTMPVIAIIGILAAIAIPAYQQYTIRAQQAQESQQAQEQ
jgi:uncharacterized membrane protein YhaH (DUF805 family)